MKHMKKRRVMGVGATLLLLSLLSVATSLPAMGSERKPPEEVCVELRTEYRVVKQILTKAGWETATGPIAYDSGWTATPTDITNRPGGPWAIDVPKTIGGDDYRYHQETREVKVEIKCPTTTTQPTTSTSTQPDGSTTTPDESTTTTDPGSTTSTTIADPTTTTVPVEGSSTMVTTTTIPTFDCVDGEVVVAEDGAGAYRDPDAAAENCTTITTSTTPPPDDPTVSTLPYTGLDDDKATMGKVGIGLFGFGVVALIASLFLKDDEEEIA